MPFWRIHRMPKRAAVNAPHGAREFHEVGQAVVASAALVSKDRVRSVMSQRSDWQADAWELYDTVSELRFGVTWIANACSRARLYVGKVDSGGASEPTPVSHSDKDGDDDTTLALAEQKIAQLQAPLDELGGGQLGQSELLRRLAIHLNIPGESYLIGYDEEESQERAWLVASPDEVQTTGGGIRLQLPDLPQHYVEIKPENSTIMRIWRPHPRFAHRAESPLMTLRQPLRELVDLSAHITATAESRLAGSGIIFVPDELTIPSPAQGEDANPIHGDPFTASLIEAMAAPLKNRDSASAVVPLVVRGPADSGKEIKHISFATKFDEQAREMRESAIRRVATGMDMPPEILLGTGDTNHWCTTADVEILTGDGWRTYDQLSVGDQVLTLNHSTGLSEWQPVQAVNTWDVRHEPMVHINGKRHSSVTTASHRWPVLSCEPEEKWLTSGEWMAAARDRNRNIYRQEHMILAAPHGSAPAHCEHPDALVEALAWFSAGAGLEACDGCGTPRGDLIQPSKTPPGHCARIERSLTALFGPPRTGEPPAPCGCGPAPEPAVGAGWHKREDRHLNRYTLTPAARATLLRHAPRGAVTTGFIRELTPGQLELFMDVCLRADGEHLTPGEAGRELRNSAANEAFEIAAILSGRSVTHTHHPGYTRSGPAHPRTTIAAVRTSEQATFAPGRSSFSHGTYTGTIWCPTTSNGTWLARRAGTVYYTGNSAWQVEESAIKLHIEPLLGLICDALTTNFYQPVLKAMGVEDWADYAIWYDTSELTLRPNRGPEALQAYQQGLISEAATRRELGFGDEDEPSGEERARHLASQVALTNANLAPYLLPRLGIPLSPAVQKAADPEGTPAPSRPGGPNPVPRVTSGSTGARPALPEQRTAAQQDHSSLATAWRRRCLDMAVRRALERAGNFLLARGRNFKNQFREVPLHEIHVHLPAEPGQLDRMLTNAYREFHAVTPGEECLHQAVDNYIRALLLAREPHRREYLDRAISQFGCEESQEVA